MWEQILPGLRIKLFMTILLGLVYPLATTGISQLLFPHQANGSLIRAAGGKVLGVLADTLARNAISGNAREPIREGRLTLLSPSLSGPGRVKVRP